jgi:hypothetical protein
MVSLISTSAPYRFAMGASRLYRPGLSFTRALMMMSPHVIHAGPYLSCPTSYRCAVKLEILSTFISCQNYNLCSRFRGRSEVFTEAGPREVVYLEEGVPCRGGRGALPSLPWWWGRSMHLVSYHLPSRRGVLGTHALPA